MTPSSKWFPTSLQERAAWFSNFSTQFNIVGLSLGFTAADATSVTDDASVMGMLGQIAPELEAYREAVRAYRVVITEGDIGDPTPDFPEVPQYGAPGGVATGIFERLVKRVDRIRAAPAYTPEIGALLGIVPSEPGPSPENEKQPTLTATSLPNSLIQVKFVRGASNGVVIETKLDNAATWSEAGRFFKSPANVVIPESAQNLPRSVQMRARYVDGDNPVGQFSPIVTAATQPTA